MNTIDKIREIKKMLNVDILTFTREYMHLMTEDIEKVEGIIYKDDVYFDEEEVKILLGRINDSVSRKHNKLKWDVGSLEHQLKTLSERRDNMKRIRDLNY